MVVSVLTPGSGGPGSSPLPGPFCCILLLLKLEIITDLTAASTKPGSDRIGLDQITDWIRDQITDLITDWIMDWITDWITDRNMDRITDHRKKIKEKKFKKIKSFIR